MLRKMLLLLCVSVLSLTMVHADVTVGTWDPINNKPTGDTVTFKDSEWQAVKDLHDLSKAAGEPDIIIGSDKIDAKELDNKVDDSSPEDLKAANNKTKESGPKANTDKCKYDPDATGSGADIRNALEHCVGDSALVQAGDLYVSQGFKDIIILWIGRIAGFLGLGAIFAIAYGSLRLTLSMGEEEKIKKAKDIIKWGILGFIAVIVSGLLIATVVNLIYGLAS